MRLQWRVTVSKLIALIMIVGLLLPTAALAANETTTFKWSFSDIADKHWGKKNVSRIGLLGITTGYMDGTFRPDRSISHEEVVIMVVRMLNVNDELGVDKVATNILASNENNQKFVDYALKQQILLPSEEQATGWATKEATREWITKLIVRAIGKKAEAAAAAGRHTGFADDSSISQAYRGFINVAKDLAIVKGDTKGNFNPMNKVKRVEMAVMIGNAEKYATKRNTNIVSGTVSSFSGASLVLATSAGSQTLTVDASAGFYTEDSDTAINPWDIGVGDYITVIRNGDKAYFIEKSNSRFEIITGILKANPIDSTITLTVSGKDQVYKYDPAKIQIQSQSGSGLQLNALVIGSTLELRRPLGEVNGDIEQIIVKSVPVLKTVIGTIASINATTSKVDVKETSSGITATYDVQSSIKITSGDKTLSGLGDLHSGDEIKLELIDNVVTAFAVTKSSVTIVEGKVDTVDEKGGKIFLLGTDNILAGYFVDTNVDVAISGLTSARLKDVQKSDDVALQLGIDNKVNKITVKNRKIESKLGLEFSLFEDNSVILKNKDKLFEVYELSDDVVLDFNGIAVTIANMGSYFTKGKKVDITYSGDRLLTMSLSNKYTGKVQEINTTTRTVKINSDQLGTISFNYVSTPSVEMFGKSSASLSDIKVGDQVQIELDSNQDKLVRIRSLQQLIVKVTSKQTGKLVVQTDSGLSADVYGATSAVITHHAKASAYFTDIAEGGYIQATIAGTNVTDIYIPNVTLGIVKSASTSAISIDEYSKSNKTISDNVAVRVVKGGTVSSSLTSLAAGDRTIIVEGKSGSRLVVTIAPVKKRFLGYTASSKTIEFFKATLSDNGLFVLNEQAYIHKGANTIDPSLLVRNDEVMVYFLGDKIIEIEKP